MTTYSAITGHGDLLGDDHDNLFAPDRGEKSDIDGFGRHDAVLLYGSSQDDFVLHVNGDVISLQNKATGEIDIRIRNVERIQFINDAQNEYSTIRFDTDGAAGQLYRLYNAAFDRAPETEGYRYWISLLDQYNEEWLSELGKSPFEVTSAFIASDEFASIYGRDVSNADFIGRLYQHVLGRDGESEGAAYWLDRVEHGMSRAELLLSFSESAENVAATAPAIAEGIYF